MFYVGAFLQDIRNSDVGFHGGKDTLVVLLHDIGFRCGEIDSR
jgi:hypothetical protein